MAFPSARVQALLFARDDVRFYLRQASFRPTVGDLGGNEQHSAFRQAGNNDIRILMSSTAKQLVTVQRTQPGAAAQTLWQGRFQSFALGLADAFIPIAKPLYAEIADMLYRVGFTLDTRQTQTGRQSLSGQLPLENIRAQLTLPEKAADAALILESHSGGQNWRQIASIPLASLADPRTGSSAKDEIALILESHTRPQALSPSQPGVYFTLPQERLRL